MKDRPQWNKENGETSLQVYNLLAEIDLLIHDYRETGSFSDSTLAYIEANERTQAIEATTIALHATHQIWSNEQRDFLGYGRSVRQISKNGITHIERVVKEKGPLYEFEKERRKSELTMATTLAGMQENGELTVPMTHISPFPENAETNIAQELGYFTDTRVAMIRQFIPHPDGTLQVLQLQIENSDIELLARLFEGEGSPKNESGIMRSLIYSKNRSIIDFARDYDILLNQKHGDRFFFGRIVDDNTPRDYDSLKEKTEIVENDTKGIIEDLVNTDIELANSLISGSPTDAISNSIHSILSISGNKSKYSLTGDQRIILSRSLNNFSRDAAKIIKKFSNINAYNMIKCLTEEETARKMFGDQTVTRTLDMYRRLNYSDIMLQQHMQQTTMDNETTYIFCGGAITNTNLAEQAYNLVNMPFGKFKKQLQSGGGERKYVKNCGACGVKIECVISSGYKCKSCGGTYEGC